MKITEDYHIHTTISSCCTDPWQTVENVAAFMADSGRKTIAFTDHFWNNPECPPSPWYAPQDGRRHWPLFKAIRNLKIDGLTILTGCEADMCAVGKIGITPELREKFDVVLLSTDHFHMKGFVELPSPVTPQSFAAHMMAFFRSGVASGLADIMAHPLFTMGYEDIYDRTLATISDAELFDAFALAANHHCAIEINAGVIHCCTNGIVGKETLLRLFSTAKAAGAKFTVGSDSHSRTEFACCSAVEKFIDELRLIPADFASFTPADATATQQ